MAGNVEVLRACVGTGEIVRIRYHGGTQPGTVRDLQPVALNGDYLLALCLSSAALKSYRLDRMDIVSEATPLTYSSDRAPRRFSTMSELAPVILPLLRELDRHVISTPISIALHGFRKDGKPRVQPEVELRLTDNKVRPWAVYAKDSGRTYGHLDRAAEAFLKTLKITPPWPVPPRHRMSRQGPDFSALGRGVYRPIDDVDEVSRRGPAVLQSGPDFSMLGRTVNAPCHTSHPTTPPAPTAEQAASKTPEAGILGRLRAWLKKG